MIDEDLLLNAVRTLQAGRRLARADTVSIKVGTIADERGRAGMWEPFPHDLVELESTGNSNTLLLRAGGQPSASEDAHPVRLAPRAIALGRRAPTMMDALA